MSTPINDGGPAFPRQHHSHPLHGGSIEGHPGMTLRDYFAGQALAGYGEAHHGATFGYTDDKGYPFRMARLSYEVADAMLAAREAQK